MQVTYGEGSVALFPDYVSRSPLRQVYDGGVTFRDKTAKPDGLAKCSVEFAHHRIICEEGGNNP